MNDQEGEGRIAVRWILGEQVVKMGGTWTCFRLRQMAGFAIYCFELLVSCYQLLSLVSLVSQYLCLVYLLGSSGVGPDVLVKSNMPATSGSRILAVQPIVNVFTD